MRVEIKEVNQRQEARLFSQFGNMLYADNPYYVPDMESDIMNMVNHQHNDSEAETIPFLAFRGDKVAGRILGIINHKANRKWNVKVVRFGFLDFIDDEEVQKLSLQLTEHMNNKLYFNPTPLKVNKGVKINGDFSTKNLHISK